jgi:CHAD domain-containing protein
MCAFADAPQASVNLIARLSFAGQRDALRQGVEPVTELREEVHPRAEELWERVIALMPHIDANGVSLEIKRSINVRLVNSQADFEPTDLFSDGDWHCPKVMASWGEPVSLDEYPASFERMVEIAEENRSELLEEFADLERVLNEKELPAWRGWLAKYIERCRADWERWIESPEISEQERRHRLRFEVVTGFRDAFELLLPDAPDADEQAERLFKLAAKARKVIQEREQVALERERKQQLVEEADEWARSHGSSRLKKAAQAGLLDVSLGIYRDERLAKEHPGWAWVEGNWVNALRPINNPVEHALDALLEAREWYPDADLRWRNLDMGGEPVVIAEFLGRQVCKICKEPPPYEDFGDEPF